MCHWLMVRPWVAWCMKGVVHLLLHFRLVPFSKKTMHLCRDPQLNLRSRYFLRKLAFIANDACSCCACGCCSCGGCSPVVVVPVVSLVVVVPVVVVPVCCSCGCCVSVCLSVCRSV